MLGELEGLLSRVPVGSAPGAYREAILQQNVLGKGTDSTRQKSLRHLRELYGLDEAIPIFGLLRKLHAIDSESLPLLAFLVAWSRDPLLRATTSTVLATSEGERVEPASLAKVLDATFPGQYSAVSRDSTAQHCASSWAQAGYLVGHVTKIRRRIWPTPVVVALALFLGDIAGYHGTEVFSNPWCLLLDLASDRARTMGFEAHRAGLLNLRAVGEVVDLSFPQLAAFRECFP